MARLELEGVELKGDLGRRPSRFLRRVLQKFIDGRSLGVVVVELLVEGRNTEAEPVEKRNEDNERESTPRKTELE